MSAIGVGTLNALLEFFPGPFEGVDTFQQSTIIAQHLKFFFYLTGK